MNNVYYYAVYADGSSKRYDQLSSFLAKSEMPALFYIRESREQEFTYGCHSNYRIITSNDNPTSYIYGDNKRLCGFTTSGIAREFVLTLELQNLSGNRRTVKLVTDARFNLSYDAYGYREWDNYNVFASVISYLYEIEKYGEEGYNLITYLRKEYWDKDRDFRNLKIENDILRSKVNIAKRSTKEIIIPNDCTNIVESCFISSDSIEKVVLHENVRWICQYAFRFCHNLKEIFCKGLTPPFVGHAAFFKIADDAKIYVPSQSVELYKNDYNWRIYQDKIVGYDYDE